jgi:hypothetical protein
VESPDRKAAWTAAAGVATVALTAAVISFSHVNRLAVEAGESEAAAWLLPVSITVRSWLPLLSSWPTPVPAAVRQA